MFWQKSYRLEWYLIIWYYLNWYVYSISFIARHFLLWKLTGAKFNFESMFQQERNLWQLKVYRSQWLTQCAYMSDIPDFNRFCRQDRKISTALLDFFFLDCEILQVGGKFKNAKRKIHFYFYFKYWKYGVGAPVKRKIKKLWPYLMKISIVIYQTIN